MRKGWAVFAVTVLTGCGHELSRSEAKNLLDEAAKKALVKINFQVTGIADASPASGLKDVKLTYEWVDPLCGGERKAGVVTPGSAVFRLYDDGWRVETIQGMDATKADPNRRPYLRWGLALCLDNNWVEIPGVERPNFMEK